MKKLILASLLTIVSLSANATASDTTTIVCNYDKYSSPEGLKSDNFELRFILDGKKAYITGNNGSSEVTMINGDQRVTFLEFTQTGTIQTTAILLNTLKSVHSRSSSTFDNNEFVASQYYGECTSL